MPTPADLGDIRFRKLRDAGGVLNATLAFIRRNARELVTAYAALVVPLALASGVASALFFSRMGEVFADPEWMFNGDLDGVFGWGYVGALAFSLLTSAVAQAAAGGFVRLYRDGQAGAITLGVLWDETWPFVLPMLGLGLLFGAVATLSVVVAIVPCLGFLAWVAFVVWLLPYYGVTTAARMTDAPTVGAAWARARELVKGSWPFAGGAYLLAALTALVVLVFVYLVVSAATSIAMVNVATDDPAAAMRLMGWVFAPIQAVTYVVYLVPMVAVFFIHGRLEEELEGTGLHDDLDVLAAGGLDDDAAGPRSTPPPPPAAPDPSPDRPDAPGGGFRGGGFRS